MILSFKPQFVNPIRRGTKIHTIREDGGNRWQSGRKIHMATGVRTKKYNCFRETECTEVQDISFIFSRPPQTPPDQPIQFTVAIFRSAGEFGTTCFGSITANFEDCDVYKSSFPLQTLAKNDGFRDSTSLLKWFFESSHLVCHSSNSFYRTYNGKIIHWTDFKY